jgi:hypothetical protein
MLARDEAFDHASDASLLLNVDERFELQRRREGSESGENLWVCWGLEGIGFGIDADGFVGRSRVDQIWQLTVAVQLGKVLT